MIKNAKIIGTNVSPAPYHLQEAKRGAIDYIMSPSSINALARLPSRWIRGWTPPGTKATSWGDLVDCKALTPQLFDARYAVEPETYPATPKKKGEPPLNKPWRYGANFTDEWLAQQEAEGKTAVSRKLLQNCESAMKRLFEVVDGDDTIQRWFDCCEFQVQMAGEWHDEQTGLVIPLACLMDFVPRAGTEFEKCLGDFKSTRSAHPIRFQKQSFDMGWHRQAAFNLDMYRAAFPDQDRNTWAFIIQENFDPWEPNRGFYGAESGMGHPGFVEIGRKSEFGGYEYWLNLYCKCVESGKWPRYNDTDESAQGWCVFRPEPFLAEKAAFSAKFEIGQDEPASEPVEEMEGITP